MDSSRERTELSALTLDELRERGMRLAAEIDALLEASGQKPTAVVVECEMCARRGPAAWVDRHREAYPGHTTFSEIIIRPYRGGNPSERAREP
ncbi:DUF7848 domain-containing protein [Streptomyces sp. 4N509B]|uniref:DUF7848 domain-containing protein n=1 Tax=Streptomyces sp. 4N509B TaxID=3457413 RepID=UPI003FD0DDCD